MSRVYEFSTGFETETPPSSGNSFTVTDNQGSAANITNMVFDKTVYRAVWVAVAIKRSTASRGETRLLMLTNNGTDWEMADGPFAAVPNTGDAGIVFSITSAGQVQYTSDAGASSTLIWEVIWSAAA